MDTFAISYKAVVLKLFECEIFDAKTVDSMLKADMNNSFKKYALLHDIGIRPTYEENFSLKELVKQNERGEAFSSVRCRN
ncbi:MAG: hypothetical protein LKE40_01190 [Spirochaetia bacterium]|jgi:hypothetical protein|nr:hypothetical protein [Spirochaetia bacterium]